MEELQKSDLLEKIRIESPSIFSILKEQQSLKWEIAYGNDYATTDNTCSTKGHERGLSNACSD